jgi:beta-glucosidase
MGGGSYSFDEIPKMVKAGKLDIKIVDQAVSRILKAKFTVGLFENPYLGVPESETPKHIHTKANVALARQIDTESIVLLENHNNILPLSKKANIAVIGPMGHGYINVSSNLNIQY